MLIFRYLAKEVFVTLAALTVILLLVVLSNQLVQYLTRAANGQIPLMFIFELILLELPNLIGFVLPLGFYVALLLAYGRLYADSEMIVLQACGYGTRQLLQHTLLMSAAVALVVMVVVLWLSPVAAIERAKLLRTTGVQMLVKMIVPGHFRPLNGEKEVLYVESMQRNHTEAHGVFLAKVSRKGDKDEWDVVWADEAYSKKDPSTWEDYLVLKSGHVYLGTPGQADYQVASFDTLEARLPHPEFTFKSSDLRVLKTSSLWPLWNTDLAKAAELQWRVSLSLMVMILTLVGVPLSRVNPRVGKYANLLPALGLFFLYANFMFMIGLSMAKYQRM